MIASQLKIGDYVISKLHTPPSPIWTVTDICDVTNTATVHLFDPQGWGSGSVRRRVLTLENLEKAPPLLVIALAADQ